MATIEPRKVAGKTRYRAKIRKKVVPHIEATFDRLTDARAWAQKTEYELINQRLFGNVSNKNKTVSDTLKRYSESLSTSNPARYKAIAPIIARWDKALGYPDSSARRLFCIGMAKARR